MKMVYKCKMCKVDKEDSEFRPSTNYKRGYTSTCKQCDNAKNKKRRQKKKVDEIKTIEQYLTIKLTNMRRMDNRYRREVIFYPTVEQLKTLIADSNNKCKYSGVELEWSMTADIYHKGSFDRIDNRFGHEVGNLQIVSVQSNMARGSKTHEEYLNEIKKAALDAVSDDDDIYVVN